jgi:hypothetical protein
MPRVRAPVLVVVLCLLAPGVARAQEQGLVLEERADDAGAGMGNAGADNRINLRLGGASTDTTGVPTICMEVRAVAGLSVEGCGTGSGFLHSQSGGEMAHFRAKWQVFGRVAAGGTLRLQGGLGFAELQLDADRPGFDFGAPRGSSIETAGPEGSVSLSWLRPMGAGWELIANTTGGLAWFPHAGALATPQDRAQPFVSFEVGVGW